MRFTQYDEGGLLLRNLTGSLPFVTGSTSSVGLFCKILNNTCTEYIGNSLLKTLLLSVWLSVFDSVSLFLSLYLSLCECVCI